MTKVALHSIGQTPRPDLTPFIVAALGIPDIIITGALDPLTAKDVAPVAKGDFPLETRLSDGTRVEVSASFLHPLIQAQIDEVENEVDLHIVLCAGPFPDLVSKSLIVRPFEYACQVFARAKMRRLLVVVPFKGQVAPAHTKWSAVGFQTDVRSMNELEPGLTADTWLAKLASESTADALVLDYVGYSKAILDGVKRKVNIPVIDLGYLAIDFAREIITEKEKEARRLS